MSKGIISILTPLIMEVELIPSGGVGTNDKERLDLIRAATRVFAELTEIQNINILVSLFINFNSVKCRTRQESSLSSSIILKSQ